MQQSLKLNYAIILQVLLCKYTVHTLFVRIILRFNEIAPLNSCCCLFSDAFCSVKKGKEGTGRAVTWRQIRAINAFTMEVSFSGASIGSRAG